MSLTIYIAHFFAGVFLANGVPHFVNGVSGRSFQTPFASPPGYGKSSPLVNAVWGFANFVIGSLLLTGVGYFEFRPSLDSFCVGCGALLISLILAWHFGRLNDGKPV
jgi:hypothetical protein